MKRDYLRPSMIETELEPELPLAASSGLGNPDVEPLYPGTLN